MNVELKKKSTQNPTLPLTTTVSAVTTGVGNRIVNGSKAVWKIGEIDVWGTDACVTGVCGTGVGRQPRKTLGFNGAKSN